MEKNKSKNFFYLCNNCIWIGCIKFSQLRREYFSSAENVLTITLKILHITKRDFTPLNCL